jgi:hypothetical protein
MSQDTTIQWCKWQEKKKKKIIIIIIIIVVVVVVTIKRKGGSTKLQYHVNSNPNLLLNDGSKGMWQNKYLIWKCYHNRIQLCPYASAGSLCHWCIQSCTGYFSLSLTSSNVLLLICFPKVSYSVTRARTGNVFQIVCESAVLMLQFGPEMTLIPGSLPWAVPRSCIFI